ncbi:MAG: YjjG family noncanonical pyrimidine nucleotidase, partial [Flavobacteriales bacterium]
LWDFDLNSKTALKGIYSELELKGKLNVDFEAFHPVYDAINHECWADYRSGRMKKEELRFIRFYKSMERFNFRDEEMAVEMGELYVQQSPLQTKLIEGSIDLLEHCKAKGYKMHIITNGFEEVQGIKLANSGLTPYFDEIITSERAGVRKPDPIIFNLAEGLTNSKADRCLMIGDDLEADIVGARNAGWNQVFFNPEGQIEHKELISKEINSLRELIPLL